MSATAEIAEELDVPDGELGRRTVGLDEEAVGRGPAEDQIQLQVDADLDLTRKVGAASELLERDVHRRAARERLRERQLDSWLVVGAEIRDVAGPSELRELRDQCPDARDLS